MIIFLIDVMRVIPKIKKISQNKLKLCLLIYIKKVELWANHTFSYTAILQFKKYCELQLLSTKYLEKIWKYLPVSCWLVCSRSSAWYCWLFDCIESPIFNKIYHLLSKSLKREQDMRLRILIFKLTRNESQISFETFFIFIFLFLFCTI